MQHRFWTHYTARDFAALDRESLIAVLPIGAIEQHGPHLPLSVDQAIVDGIVAASAPLIPDDVPALFLPTMPVGKSTEHSAWPGTLTFSTQTLISIYTEIGDSVAAAGVRKLVFLNSHGGQIAVMDIVARDLRIKHNMLTVGANWFAMGLPEGLLTPEEERFGIHAGDMETSVMRALHPDHVQMEHARDFPAKAAELAGKFKHLGLSAAGKLGWQAQDMNAAGACGDASKATAEKGEAFIQHAAEQIVTLLQEVHATPLSFLETEANPEAHA
ncbi:creatininase family protein [Citreicella sp. C3M06]|uniref:creatininase family protein n=1 Tax=Citreicella sp. C3M06 TaxID=2841564 RepID=UPI001C0937A4|nr:creatininase family protein [Citreicella sp. C3M06]MBU2963433.1 creatininase family protein [Citreicella sp. C3M06]